MWNQIDPLVALIQEHLRYRPNLEPRDVYKLLYQGVRGPEHLITSPEAFRERLWEEWNPLDLGDGNDPLWESIRLDGGLLRLNLRPFKAHGGRLEALVTACLETGRRRWGTQAELQQAWEGFKAACKIRTWPGLDLDRVEVFSAWLTGTGFPPVHHSERYRSLYRPAYRLVASDVRVSILGKSVRGLGPG
jgi:hypothetical protein